MVTNNLNVAGDPRRQRALRGDRRRRHRSPRDRGIVGGRTARPGPGHVQFAQHPVRPAGGGMVSMAQRSSGRSIPSPAGWSTTDEIWTPAGGAQRPRQAGIAPRGRRHRHHQPARDHGGLGPRTPAKPIHNAIVWQDRRTDRCDAAARSRGMARGSASAPGWWSTYFSGTKLAWLLDHVPARARGGAGRAGLRHHRRLARSGAHRRPGCTPPTPATPRAPCCSTSHRAWDAGCSRCSTSRAVLPQACPSAGDLRRNRSRPPARRSHAGHRRRPAGGTLFGQACFAPGMAARTPTAPAASC